MPFDLFRIICTQVLEVVQFLTTVLNLSIIMFLSPQFCQKKSHKVHMFLNIGAITYLVMIIKSSVDENIQHLLVQIDIFLDSKLQYLQTPTINGPHAFLFIKLVFRLERHLQYRSPFLKSDTLITLNQFGNPYALLISKRVSKYTGKQSHLRFKLHPVPISKRV